MEFVKYFKIPNFLNLKRENRDIFWQQMRIEVVLLICFEHIISFYPNPKIFTRPCSWLLWQTPRLLLGLEYIVCRYHLLRLNHVHKWIPRSSVWDLLCFIWCLLIYCPKITNRSVQKRPLNSHSTTWNNSSGISTQNVISTIRPEKLTIWHLKRSFKDQYFAFNSYSKRLSLFQVPLQFRMQFQQ